MVPLIFQKHRSHLKIQGAKKGDMKQIFNTEYRQILVPQYRVESPCRPVSEIFVPVILCFIYLGFIACSRDCTALNIVISIE